MNKKLKEWVRRYLPGEIFGTIFAFIAAVSVFLLTKSRIASAFAGAMGENIGYYGYIFFREHKNDKNRSKAEGKKHGARGFLKTSRNLLLEFGFSEIFDSFLIRPFSMYIFPLLLGNFALGILVGKLAADITFYVPTIISYELRKKYLK